MTYDELLALYTRAGGGQNTVQSTGEGGGTTGGDYRTVNVPGYGYVTVDQDGRLVTTDRYETGGAYGNGGAQGIRIGPGETATPWQQETPAYDSAAAMRRGLGLVGGVLAGGYGLSALGVGGAAGVGAGSAAGGAAATDVAAGLPALAGPAPIGEVAASFGATGGAAGGAAGAAGAAGSAAGAAGVGSTLSSLLPYGAAAVSGIAGANASRQAGQIQADAATRAADSTLQATRESNQLLRDMYNTGREDNKPWLEAGRTALSSLTAGTAPGGEFTQRFDASRMYEDPGYAFRLAEGRKALEASAAARGGLLSGGTARNLTRYGQDYASGEYGAAYSRWNNDQTNRFNRLSSLAGTGQTAVRDNNAAGMSTASQVGQNTIAGANNAGQMTTGAAAARASGYVGGTNAITNAVGQGLNNMQSTRLMDLLERRR